MYSALINLLTVLPEYSQARFSTQLLINLVFALLNTNIWVKVGNNGQSNIDFLAVLGMTTETIQSSKVGKSQN